MKVKPWNMKSMDVKGKKLQRASMRATITAKMETDYEKKWEGHSIRHFFRNLFEKFVAGDVFDEHEKEIMKDMRDLKYALKQHLNLFKTERE